MTQNIRYNVGLAIVVKYTHVIIIQKFKSSCLLEIQYLFCKHILKKFMVSKNINMYTIEVVSPYFQIKN